MLTNTMSYYEEILVLLMYLCIASDWGFLLYVYKGSYLRPYDGKLSLLSIYQKSLLHSSPLPFRVSPLSA